VPLRARTSRALLQSVRVGRGFVAASRRGGAAVCVHSRRPVRAGVIGALRASTQY
jgi:hypothetical protein